jgi:hypothetical protein
MNTQAENQDTAQNPAYNPFPEPQTIPSGWDTSGFLSNPEPTSDAGAKSLTENESD